MQQTSCVNSRPFIISSASCIISQYLDAQSLVLEYSNNICEEKKDHPKEYRFHTLEIRVSAAAEPRSYHVGHRDLHITQIYRNTLRIPLDGCQYHVKFDKKDLVWIQ
ncbi:hypothetical protein CEXT_57451 [Caerostris extrusa]|uniref:Peptidase S1 domain-containing protein n=1 Tax=Caerostris extrusa TaxID=172846 RepID=A0AAV4NTH9_CAEEX|nr:hypothetical protein CEXT_57451 [Caerostris extrusa]